MYFILLHYLPNFLLIKHTAKLEGLNLDCTASAVQLFAEVRQFYKNKILEIEYIGGWFIITNLLLVLDCRRNCCVWIGMCVVQLSGVLHFY